MSTKSTGTIYNDFQFSSLVATGVVAVASILLVVFKFWSLNTTPKVKILLQDEIKSARQRALEYCFNPRAVMAKGYARFKNEVFGLDTQDGMKLVIPPRFLDELKSHPALSFKVSIDNDMQIEYTHFGGPEEYVIHAIKANLTGSLYWTPVKVHDKVLRLIATNNARVFQGTTASLDEEWLAASTGYVLACFDCIRALKQWHPYLRPLVYRFIPERAAIKDQWAKGRKRVMASMRERQEKGGNLEDPPTMLDHLSNGRNEHIKDDVELQLLHQMTLIAVGTVTTFSSTTQAIYDLVAHPEYIPIKYVRLSRRE
ncbi:ent-kaurene oxidase [Fusarium coicis]|nr:ent-kaurene oxidase [Fusarium coicis]